MSVDRIKLNRKGVAALLKSPEVKADIRSRAGRIAATAGPGFEARTSVGRTRARAVVITTTSEARLAQAKDRKLSNAISAGR
jgi:hypothetical protein